MTGTAKPRPDEYVARDQLGLWWPQLGGRVPERLAAAGRGPKFMVGRQHKAWYQVRDVEAWCEAEKKRGAEAPLVTAEKGAAPAGLRKPARPKAVRQRRLTRLERFRLDQEARGVPSEPAANE